MMKMNMSWLTTLFRPNRGNKRSGVVGAVVGGSMATVIAISLPMVQQHEGLRTDAYLDPVGIPTICFGETLGVKMGDSATPEECQEMLIPRMEGFLREMRACTQWPENISGGQMPAKTEAAFLSFTYNLGSSVYCRNIAGKRINRGNVLEACEALSLYNRAGNRIFRGLVIRRAEERELCVEGLLEAGAI